MSLPFSRDRFKGLPWTQAGHTKAAACLGLSRIAIRRSSTGSCVWSYSNPTNIPPFSSMAICEPLRGIFSFGLVAFPREGSEGLGWEI
jgi:hypothetical protein